MCEATFLLEYETSFHLPAYSFLLLLEGYISKMEKNIPRSSYLAPDQEPELLVQIWIRQNEQWL
jgi:hypothetical protein